MSEKEGKHALTCTLNRPSPQVWAQTMELQTSRNWNKLTINQVTSHHQNFRKCWWPQIFGNRPQPLASESNFTHETWMYVNLIPLSQKKISTEQSITHIHQEKKAVQFSKHQSSKIYQIRTKRLCLLVFIGVSLWKWMCTIFTAQDCSPGTSLRSEAILPPASSAGLVHLQVPP